MSVLQHVAVKNYRLLSKSIFSRLTAYIYLKLTLLTIIKIKKTYSY